MRYKHLLVTGFLISRDMIFLEIPTVCSLSKTNNNNNNNNNNAGTCILLG